MRVGIVPLSPQPSAMLDTFIQHLRTALDTRTLVKVTLSKASDRQSELTHLYLRPILLKEEPHLAFTYRYRTRDEAKNFDLEAAFAELTRLLPEVFLHAQLLTTERDYALRYSKKRKAHLSDTAPSHTAAPAWQHDHAKHRLIAPDAPFLHPLGITSATGKVLDKKQAKYKQINKYIEIIDSLLTGLTLDKPLRIVDMGSGKGYLTFALYEYLVQQRGLNVQLTGVELRPHLVDFCSEVAQAVGYSGLRFEARDIMTFEEHEIDLLIALHACDIATDIAIAKGIGAQAQLIVCAPCCHKQVRQSMTLTPALQPMLKHGILAERQAEMVTDAIRALTLEGHGYDTKVFEFISSEHTAKNVMITATRTSLPRPTAFAEITALMTQFGVSEHYLQRLLPPTP